MAGPDRPTKNRTRIAAGKSDISVKEHALRCSADKRADIADVKQQSLSWPDYIDALFAARQIELEGIRMPTFVVPSKIFTYLRRLLLNYEHSGRQELARILKHGRVAISPDADRYYDFGRQHYGHAVAIFLPPELIAPLDIPRQAELSEALRDDLAACAKSYDDEYISAVRIELEDEEDFLFQTSRGLSGAPATNPDILSFWTPGLLRVFISHRAPFKREARALGDELEKYGLSCFVAHDTIEPMESWQHQIEKGLETMELFLALITDDFHGSVWTNQEVGFAKANGVPVICLKLGADPEGFIADKQALAGDPASIKSSAPNIYRLLTDKLGMRERLQGALVTAFCEMPDWGEARPRFDRMSSAVKNLSDAELEQIQEAYEANDQLRTAAYLRHGERLKRFLRRTSGKDFVLGNKKLELEKSEEDDEIPF